MVTTATMATRATTTTTMTLGTTRGRTGGGGGGGGWGRGRWSAIAWTWHCSNLDHMLLLCCFGLLWLSIRIPEGSEISHLSVFDSSFSKMLRSRSLHDHGHGHDHDDDDDDGHHHPRSAGNACSSLYGHYNYLFLGFLEHG